MRSPMRSALWMGALAGTVPPVSRLHAQSARAPRVERAARPGPAGPPFEVTEVTIPQLQAALAAGRVTSVQLVGQYLARIAPTIARAPRSTPS